MFGKLDFGFPTDMRFPAQEPIEPPPADPPEPPAAPPEPPPADPPPAEGDPPAEPQFASADEELAAIKVQLTESQSHIGRQTNELKILREFARHSGDTPPADVDAPPRESILAGIDTSGIFNDSDAVLNAVAERILEVGEGRMTAYMEANTRAKSASDSLRQEFFTAHPHLEQFPEIVFAMSDKVHKANPNVRDPRVLLGVIGDECDAYIERLAKTAKPKEDPPSKPKPKSKRPRIGREPEPPKDRGDGKPQPGDTGLQEAMDYADKRQT